MNPKKHTNTLWLKKAKCPTMSQLGGLESRGATKKAKDGQKLILTQYRIRRHWKHVMEHECFEMKSRKNNEHHFINIKVDREEFNQILTIFIWRQADIDGSGGY
jgi:uncharacterized protein YyaL (SSP411 family)